MSQNFIYYGDDSFKKFDFVQLSSTVAGKSNIQGLIFNSLLIDGKLCEIDDVISCWSFNLFRVGNRIYHCGFNGKDIDNKPSLVFPKSNSLTSNQTIELLSAGWKKVMVLSDQCYLLSEDGYFRPEMCDISSISSKVKNVSLSDSQHFFVTADGSVYISSQASMMPSILYMPTKVKEVSCGKEHTLFLTVSGCVYSVGSSSRGQLGHGNTDCIDKPELIEALDGIVIKTIAAGGWHSVAVSVSDDLYTWGWNESGQLGRPCGKTVTNAILSPLVEEICCLPKLVDFENDVPIVAVSCGSRHSAVLFGDHSVFTWGWNGHSQLGRNVESCSHVPARVEIPSCLSPRRIQCSPWSTLIIGIEND